MIRINYVMKKEVVNKSNISKFVINEKDRRDIREGKVKEILKTLQKNKHFSAPFVVNEINRNWRLIDGNHRFEAISKQLTENRNFEIVVWLAVYRNLSLEEEREVYREWNIGTPQTATDFLKAYFDTIPLGKELLKKLPVSIYGDKQNMPIKNLVGCQISAKKHRKFDGGYSSSKEEVINDFRDINLDDIDNLENFVEFMKEAFGQYHKGSQFYQTTPLFAFYRIWFDNRNVDKERLVRSFQRVFNTNPQTWEVFTKVGSRVACQTFYRASIESLNSIVKTIHFKNDEEMLELYDKEKNLLAPILKAVKQK